jgi:hypothetical protein
VGSSESKAKGSFGQKEFYSGFSSHLILRVSSHFVAKTTTCCICMWKLSFLKYGNTHLIGELYYKIGR